jgi:hypothetical protein
MYVLNCGHEDSRKFCVFDIVSAILKIFNIFGSIFHTSKVRLGVEYYVMKNAWRGVIEQASF